MTPDLRIMQQTRLIRDAAMRLLAAETDAEQSLWLATIDTRVREIKVAATGNPDHYEI